jgi:hypothetical protein
MYHMLLRTAAAAEGLSVGVAGGEKGVRLMRNRPAVLDGRKLGMGLAMALLILGLSAAPAFGQGEDGDVTQINDCDPVQVLVAQYNSQTAVQIQYNINSPGSIQAIAQELNITAEQVFQCLNVVNDNDRTIVRGDDGDGNDRDDIDIDNTDRNDVDIDNTNINTNTNINDVNGNGAATTVAAATGAATSSATATAAAATGGSDGASGGDGAAGTVGLEQLPDTGGPLLLGIAAIVLASVLSGASVLWAGVRRRR